MRAEAVGTEVRAVAAGGAWRAGRPALTGSLAARLLKTVFGCYFVVTIIVTGVQLGVTYRQAEQRLISDIEAIGRTFGPGIGDAMWSLNDDVLRGIVTGMSQLPAVIGIKIVDENDRVVLAVGTIRAAGGNIVVMGSDNQPLPLVEHTGFVDTLFSRDFPVIHVDPSGVGRAIGHWTVYSNREIIVGRVLDDFLIILINSVIKTAALWLILFVVVERVIGRPLREVSAFVARLDINTLDGEPLVPRDRGHHELRALSDTLNLMTAKLRRSFADNARLLRDLEVANITLQSRVEERTRELEKLARTDALTGLVNRRMLDEVLDDEINRVRRFGGTLSIIIGDVDHFKEINDQYGHQVGDQVLVACAGILKGATRVVDTAGRWGGEEFMIVCPQTPLSGIVALAERVRQRMATTGFPNVAGITCSFGVAEWINGEAARDFVARADAALYRAKQAGRDRVERDDPTGGRGT